MSLEQDVKVAFADTFAFYLKAHAFHWNVEGPNFPQYHTLFQIIYSEVYGAIDLLAEHIRTLDFYAPGSLQRFKELATVEDENVIPSDKQMIARLTSDNVKVISSLTKAYESAEKDKRLGLANFLQDRIDQHEKHGWMLRSSQRT